MGVDSLKVQLKASIILYKFIVVVAIGETKTYYKQLKILENIYIECEIHKIINQKSIKHDNYNIKKQKQQIVNNLNFIVICLSTMTKMKKPGTMYQRTIIIT